MFKNKLLKNCSFEWEEWVGGNVEAERGWTVRRSYDPNYLYYCQVLFIPIVWLFYMIRICNLTDIMSHR